MRFELWQPYAAAERLFDSIAILPRHLLKGIRARPAYQGVEFNNSARQIAGLGPFRIKEYVPGQHITLARNPYYWKQDIDGNRLPYLDEIVCYFYGKCRGRGDAVSARRDRRCQQVKRENFSALEKHQQAESFAYMTWGEYRIQFSIFQSERSRLAKFSWNRRETNLVPPTGLS